jgi:hypothetical protein
LRISGSGGRRKNQLTIMTFVGTWPLTKRSIYCFLNSIIQLIMCNLLLCR